MAPTLRPREPPAPSLPEVKVAPGSVRKTTGQLRPTAKSLRAVRKNSVAPRGIHTAVRRRKLKSGLVCKPLQVYQSPPVCGPPQANDSVQIKDAAQVNEDTQVNEPLQVRETSIINTASHTDVVDQSTFDTPFPFVRLPTELRLMVYRFALASKRMVAPLSSTLEWRNGHFANARVDGEFYGYPTPYYPWARLYLQPVFPLLLVNKKVNEESVEVMHRIVPVSFKLNSTLLRALLPEGLQIRVRSRNDKARHMRIESIKKNFFRFRNISISVNDVVRGQNFYFSLLTPALNLFSISRMAPMATIKISFRRPGLSMIDKSGRLQILQTIETLRSGNRLLERADYYVATGIGWPDYPGIPASAFAAEEVPMDRADQPTSLL